MAYLYQFERAPDVSGSPGSWANIGPNSAATTFNDSGLTPNTLYWYRCQVSDSIPNSANSSAVETTTSGAVRAFAGFGGGLVGGVGGRSGFVG